MSRRWTAADLGHLNVSGITPSAGTVKTAAAKYRHRAEVIDGIRFDSQLEARLYQQIKLRKAAGEFRPPYFLRQVSFHLPGGVRYQADFVTFLAGGGSEVIDAKGFSTPAGKNKIKQVEALYEIKIILWSDQR